MVLREENTMARPMKWRRVCCIPEIDTFGPMKKAHQGEEVLVMTIDEYETIRLMDYEGLTQEECAAIMGVARTTVQSIYAAARKKLSEVLVFGLTLKIEGGEVRIGEGQRPCSERNGQKRGCCQNPKENPCDCE